MSTEVTEWSQWTQEPPPGTRAFELLHSSNNVPLDTEILPLTRASAELQHDINRVEKEILELEAQLAERRKHKGTLISKQSRIKGAISPLRRFPSELLAEIFQLLALPESAGRNFATLFRKFDMRWSPWSLTHVCSRWRAIATTMPSLWSSLIVVFSDEDDAITYPLPLLQTHVRRARDLFVHFCGSQSLLREPQTAAFDIISELSEDIVELSLTLTTALFPEFNHLIGRFPRLRRVRLDWDDPEVVHDDHVPILCLETAPSLREVTIANEHCFLPAPLPTSELTWCCLDAPWEVHRGILSLAKNLRTVYIHVAFDDHVSWPEQTEPIFLQGLCQLYASHPEVLEYLQLPGLEKVAFRVEGDELEFIEQLVLLVHRSGCVLRSVRLVGSPTILALKFLENIKSVNDLRMLFSEEQPDWDQITNIMRGLAQTSHRLRYLGFMVEGKNRVDELAFITMVKSRMDYGLEIAEWWAENKSRSGIWPTILAGVETLCTFGQEGRQMTFKYGEGELIADLWDEWLFYR